MTGKYFFIKVMGRHCKRLMKKLETGACDLFLLGTIKVLVRVNLELKMIVFVGPSLHT